MGKQWPDPPKRRSPMDSGNNRKPPVCSCECPMVAAGYALKRGKLRLAARYARMSIRLLGSKVVGA
jgi:hypothetical protein